jgi:hypothetical protein
MMSREERGSVHVMSRLGRWWIDARDEQRNGKRCMLRAEKGWEQCMG